MTKTEHKIGAILAVATLAAVAFVIGRLSATSWQIGGDTLEKPASNTTRSAPR